MHIRSVLLVGILLFGQSCKTVNSNPQNSDIASAGSGKSAMPDNYETEPFKSVQLTKSLNSLNFSELFRMKLQDTGYHPFQIFVGSEQITRKNPEIFKSLLSSYRYAANLSYLMFQNPLFQYQSIKEDQAKQFAESEEKLLDAFEVKLSTLNYPLTDLTTANKIKKLRMGRVFQQELKSSSVYSRVEFILGFTVDQNSDSDSEIVTPKLTINYKFFKTKVLTPALQDGSNLDSTQESKKVK